MTAFLRRNTGRCEVLLSFRKIQWDRIVLYLNIKFGTIPALNRIEEPNAVSNLVTEHRSRNKRGFQPIELMDCGEFRRHKHHSLTSETLQHAGPDAFFVRWSRIGYCCFRIRRRPSSAMPMSASPPRAAVPGSGTPDTGGVSEGKNTGRREASSDPSVAKMGGFSCSCGVGM